jgi:hypothetical protein
LSCRQHWADNQRHQFVKTITLRVGGIVVPVTSLMILDGVLCCVGRGVAALPRPIKTLLAASAVIALARPDSRRWLVERCVDLGTILAAAGQSLIEIGAQLMAMDNEAQSKAGEYLATASSLIKPQKRFVRRQRRVARVGRVRKKTLGATARIK